MSNSKWVNINDYGVNNKLSIEQILSRARNGEITLAATLDEATQPSWIDLDSPVGVRQFVIEPEFVLSESNGAKYIRLDKKAIQELQLHDKARVMTAPRQRHEHDDRYGAEHITAFDTSINEIMVRNDKKKRANQSSGDVIRVIICGLARSLVKNHKNPTSLTKGELHLINKSALAREICRVMSEDSEFDEEYIRKNLDKYL
jgi:hypothetical protein|tara:strand:- start:448 stop:1053 length:606 start_codon:yes stop_codon:yes gene_type:complete